MGCDEAVTSPPAVIWPPLAAIVSVIVRSLPDEQATAVSAVTPHANRQDDRIVINFLSLLDAEAVGARSQRARPVFGADARATRSSG
jgi:hypothetical protein